MPLYKNRLDWTATADQELTGSVTTMQAYSAAGVADSIPANFLKAGDTIIYDAVWEVTGKDGATYFIPNIYWGGVASGIALMDSNAVISSALGQIIYGRAIVTIRTAGSSPVWHSSGLWFLNTNSTYQNFVASFANVTIPTNVVVPVEAAARLVYGAPTASDKVKLRSFSRNIRRV